MGIINEAYRFIGLRKPFTVEMVWRKNKSATAKYWGLYNEKGVLKSHRIKVYIKNLDNPNERDIDILIIHELVHAWQEENGFSDIHGKSFKEMAARLCGGGFGEVYGPELDK